MAEWGPVDDRVLTEAERINDLAVAMRYSAGRRIGAIYAGYDHEVLAENQRLREMAREILRLLGGESGTEPGVA